MNLTTIEDKFEEYNLPKLNWVRLPNIKIEDSEKEDLGLSHKATNIDFLKRKTFKGLELRESKNQIDKSKKQQYIDRINEEISLVDELGFCDYYLLVWRTIEYAKKFTSYLDPARGSCGGSIVFYMMGVTQLDPVKHELFLSRFISKARANKKIIDGITYIQGDLAPDVDINFSKDIREKVIHWLEKEYGGKMAQISTYNSFTTKILLKECYKSLIDEGNEDDAKKISDCVQSKFGKLESIETVYENNTYFKSFCDENPEIIKVAKKLQNLPKATGSHASGFVISFDPLNKVCQLSLNKENQLTCVYEMNDISKLSLKLDLLGLTTNKIIDDCLKEIGKTYDDINLDEDPEIYRHFQSPYLGTGIYQIEKGCAYNVTRAVKPKNVGELSDVNALARPGALSYLGDYTNNTGECPHEVFRPILAKTRYQPLYQEQMIQMAIAIGFSPEEGEIIRRVVSKKKKDQIAEWKPKIEQKCINNKYGIDVAEYFWKLLEESADYSFNLSHSLGVSYVGALTTYLKYNHPKEFYTSFLNNCKEFPDFVEKTSSAIRELKHFGIKILAPDLLKSKDDFTVENDGIRYGLRYIKGVSDNSLSQLAEFKQKYDNKFDVFKAIDDLKIKLNVVCPLIQAGALEHENKYGRTYCVFEAQIWKNLTVKEKNIMMDIGQDFNYDLPLCLRHLIETGKIKPSRAATLRKNTEKYKEIYNNNKKYTDIVNWFYEYKLLGFSYSYELVDVFKDFEKSKGRPELFDFVSLDDLVSNHMSYQEQTIRIVGIVTEKVIKESQKTGNKYLRCTIEDGKNRFDVFLMDKKGQIDDMIIEQGRTPEKEDLICCQGRLSKTEDEDKIPVLFADSIRIQKDVNVFMKLHDLNTYKKSKS